MKKQYMECDKIFANNVTHKGLFYKIYKQLMHFNLKINQEVGKKTPK